MSILVCMYVGDLSCGVDLCVCQTHCKGILQYSQIVEGVDRWREVNGAITVHHWSYKVFWWFHWSFSLSGFVFYISPKTYVTLQPLPPFSILNSLHPWWWRSHSPQISVNEDINHGSKHSPSTQSIWPSCLLRPALLESYKEVQACESRCAWRSSELQKTQNSEDDSSETDPITLAPLHIRSHDFSLLSTRKYSPS